MSEETLAAQHNDDSFANVWQELKWRGLVHVSTDEEALEKALSEESINFYIGYDPTAASLHLGHLVQLLLMRRLQPRSRSALRTARYSLASMRPGSPLAASRASSPTISS